jgi:hypothetical protein
MNQKCSGCLAALLSSLLLTRADVKAAESLGAAHKFKGRRGEFGGDLSFLHHYYTPPSSPAESNHYFDLWSGTTLPLLARVNRLTNNHALFIDSHGRSERSLPRKRYAYYPHRDLLPPDQRPPCFSARDLAEVVGSAAGDIHNIFVGGCDIESSFDPQELRKYFVNATNIVHTVAGENGFKPMFYSAIVNPSWANTALYATRGLKRNGDLGCHLSKTPAADACIVNPYFATLFRPGESEPYRKQVAGRELIEPMPIKRRPRPPRYHVGIR